MTWEGVGVRRGDLRVEAIRYPRVTDFGHTWLAIR